MKSEDQRKKNGKGFRLYTCFLFYIVSQKSESNILFVMFFFLIQIKHVKKSLKNRGI